MCATTKKEIVAAKEPEITDFTSVVGGGGPWQRIIFVMVLLTGLPSAWHTLVMPFFAPNIDYWCAKPSEYKNVTTEQWRLYGIPAGSGEITDYSSRCQRYEHVNFTHIPDHHHQWQNGTLSIEASSKRSLVYCKKWEYDHSEYARTIVSEWDLVCDKSWTVSTVNSLFMAGCLTSVIVFGLLSDRIGRKPVLMTCVISLLITGTICAFSTSYTMFAITRYFVALGTDGIFVIGFIILMETVGTEYRSAFGMAVNCGWCTGYVMLPLIAYLLKDWFWIQIAITLPCIGLLSMYWLVPESPRWLIVHNKIDRAEVILKDAAHKNKMPVDQVDIFLQKVTLKPVEKEEKKSSGTIFDLFRTSGLWQKTINLVLCWFVSSFVYYGLSFNTNDLGGNPFVNFAVSGAVEFPAYFISVFVIKSLGRRIPLTVTLVAGGLACLFTIFLTGDLAWIKTPLAMVGKFCVTAAYAILYVYTAEIFPTVVRNTGVGICSMAARFGSILAPFVKELGRATHPAVPLVCYGGLTVVSGFLILLLPETNKCKVPDTLEEAADFGRKWKKESNLSEAEKGENIFTISSTITQEATSARSEIPNGKIMNGDLSSNGISAPNS